METKTNIIEIREYSLQNILEDEIDVLNRFSEFSGHISDAISQIADGATPIYNYDIWENAKDISDSIEEAISQGIASTDGDIDLMKIFQSGYYVFYNQLLHDNLDNLMYNYVATKLNEELDNLDKAILKGLDVSGLEADINSEMDYFDNNSDFDALDDKVTDFIDQIKEGDYTEAS